uniref:DUF4238 domain-containing protein n=1 Tax=Caenorhabditis tropicalis TaxID=1561998 RepID=A0A1I7TLC5_9PELO
MSTVIGFVCEVSEQKVRVFTKSYKLIEMPYLPEMAPSYGDCLKITSKESYEIGTMNVPYFKISSENDDVFVQLLVIGPDRLSLPKKVADKYEQVVWSPHLELIRDPNHVYSINFKGGDVREVVVKYAPSSDGSFFEVFRAVQWLDGEQENSEETKKSYLRMAPWLMETLTDRAPIYNLCPEDMASTNLKKHLHKDDCATGICIHHEFPNPGFREDIKGSSPTVAVLWSPMTGLSRWNINNRETHTEFAFSGDPLLQLGEWFTYSFNDQRTSGSKRAKLALKREEFGEDVCAPRNERPTFFAATASDVTRLDPVKPTRRIVCETLTKDGEKILEHNIEIECSFQFKHSSLENESNRSVKNWDARERCLRRDAHFDDFYLGKIRIYPEEARLIIEKIENFREVLKESSSEEYKLRQEDMIIIRGAVLRSDKFSTIAQSYPTRGLFYLEKVFRIAYHRDGKVIYQNPEEKYVTEVPKDLSTIQVKF